MIECEEVQPGKETHLDLGAWVTDYVVRADFGFSEGFRAFILVFERHF